MDGSTVPVPSLWARIFPHPLDYLKSLIRDNSPDNAAVFVVVATCLTLCAATIRLVWLKTDTTPQLAIVVGALVTLSGYAFHRNATSQERLNAPAPPETPMIENIKTAVAGLTLGAVLGLGVGWTLYHGKATQQQAALAVTQRDGSVELAKQPDAKAKPKQEIPKGSTVVRIVEVTVQPHGQPAGAQPATSGSVQPVGGSPLSLPPVTLDLTLTKDPQGQERVIASSPDGTVTGGIDIPVADAVAVKATPWAVGVSRSIEWPSGKQVWGGLIERDLGAFRAGLLITRDNMTAMVAIRF